jgi:hypothetical protein
MLCAGDRALTSLQQCLHVLLAGMPGWLPGWVAAACGEQYMFRPWNILVTINES